MVKSRPVIVKDDPSDDKFIHCAMAGRADIIISGDRHLTALKSYGNIEIYTLNRFLEEL